MQSRKNILKIQEVALKNVSKNKNILKPLYTTVIDEKYGISKAINKSGKTIVIK